MPPLSLSRSVAAAAFAAVLLLAAPGGSAVPAPDPGHYPAVAPEPLAFAWTIDGEEARLRSDPWFSGAVSSLTFRGVEYVDSADHGRLLQGALHFKGAGECLNPTQAGASRDRPPRSSSRLLWVQVRPDSYATATQMAYWKRPGEHCGRPGERRRALNRTRLSDTVYTQVLRPGFRGFPNAMLHEITFTTGSHHEAAVVEALTAYTPPSFDTFHVYRPETGRFVVDPTVAASPGERPGPVILATGDGSSAIGLVALTRDPPARYGRFTYAVTNKINMVFRPEGAFRAGSHTYEGVWAIGTLGEVEETIRGVMRSRPET